MIQDMDENYFMYVEGRSVFPDVEKGWKVIYCPHAEILHHIGVSTHK